MSRGNRAGREREKGEGKRERQTLHLALLGDSVFDNGAYTGRDPAVITHLTRILPRPWRASLLAVDGATTAGIGAQVKRFPQDVSHIALSVGGNDALGHLDLLSTPVTSTAEALDLFHSRAAGFESAYRAALDQILALGRPALVCTIYNGALPDPDQARRARLALTFFNDVIVRVAWERACPILDLRLLCVDAGDYANPIEPSGQGGAKIASALARAVGALPGHEPGLYTPHAPLV